LINLGLEPAVVIGNFAPPSKGGEMFRLLVAFVAAMLSVAAEAAEPVWRASETEHFIIYSKSPQQRVEQLATDVESYDKLMRMATGIREDVQPVKVRIYEVDGLEDVQKALGLDYTSAVGGFYSSNSLGPFLVTPRRMDSYVGPDFTSGLVLHHEYAHHFMLQYFPAAYPGWYTEGFAELIGSSKVLDDGRIGYGMPAKQRGHEIAVDWAPLQELLTQEKPWGVDNYAQGWALTHFFTFDKTRSKEFRAYLEALNSGQSLADAAKAFGDLNRLDREARAYVTRGSFEYRPIKVDVAQPVIEKSRTLSPGEAALIPQVIAYDDTDLGQIEKKGDREHERARRERNLERTRQFVQQYPSDQFALSFLAESEYSVGNYPQAEAAADRLLAIRPTDVHGLARKAIAMAVQARDLPAAQKTAELEQARALAAKANHLDTDDPLPLLAYYETFHEAGEKAPEIAVEGLMQVVSTDPRDALPRELLVDELAAGHRWAEAIACLGPLANNPHESPLRDSARQKMAWLKEQLAKAGGPQRNTGSVVSKSDPDPR
jgi:tetratricopeptide (TPR) repeat protein